MSSAAWVQRYRDALARWLSPWTPSDGASEADLAEAERSLGFPLPEAVRDLMVLVGRRRDLTNDGQNYLVLPAPRWYRDGHLVIYVENQQCHTWSVALPASEADPPVYIDRTTVASPHTSTFALAMLLVEAVFRGVGGMGWPSPEAVAAIRAQFQDAGISVRLSDLGDTVFYYGPDTLLMLDHQDPDALCVNARTPQAVDQLMAIAGIVWEDSPRS